jgi:hypothetical protein
MLHGESSPVDIQFAASRDGIHWNRYDRQAIIQTGFDRSGNEISFEKGSLYAGYGLTRKGDEISFYYTTLASPHVIPPPNTGIITRATYRLDGFTSIDAGNQIGQFTTPAMAFHGSRLQINFLTSVEGWVEVEIVDAQGKPFEGYGMTKADRLSGDDVCRTVLWGGRRNISSMQRKHIRLHFRMHDAKLYAFQFVAR